MHPLELILLAVAALTVASTDTRALAQDEPILIPQIDGDWWRVAGDPDLGEFTDPKQQPVDFGIWQALDGTWQLWSCIRGTRCGGNTRLFYAWEGQQLTDADWQPRGIAMQADAQYAETPGGLQAPHVIKIGGVYHMVYGDWEHICLARSEDGKAFERVLDSEGKAGLFTQQKGANTRDAMLLPVGDQYYCYYTAHPHHTGAVWCRVSKDLRSWGGATCVAIGGSAGTGPSSAECPFVYHHAESGWYYLFRTQRYGPSAQTSVYRSRDPLDFGINDDRCLVCRLPVAAPEIIEHEGQCYVASLMPSLKGIRVARLKWAPKPERGPGVLNLDDRAVRASFRVLEGRFDPLFTRSTRTHFGSHYQHFIGTAEGSERAPDDSQQGVIESPPFAIEHAQYIVLVSGGMDRARTYVALVSAESSDEVARLNGRNDNRLEEHVVDTSEFVGRQALVRIVDQSTESWGHVNFGGIFPLISPAEPASEEEKAELRRFVAEKCGLPTERVPLDVRFRGNIEYRDYTLEKLVYDSESGVSVPAHLYLPRGVEGPVPAVVLACGHGGSKSVFFNQYAGQLYAKAGLAVLATDPMGEEERDPEGRIGTRTHDRISEQAQALGRPVVGAMVWDLMRGIDLLEGRPEIDPERIVVAGHSLGAIVGMYLAALDERVKAGALAAMYFARPQKQKFCTQGMYELIADRLDYPALLSLAAPRCAVFILVGDDDAICGARAAYRERFIPFTRRTSELFAAAGAAEGFDWQVWPDAGHRPYFLTTEALLWLEKQIDLPKLTAEQIAALPSVKMSEWAEANGVVFEELYGTEIHNAGMEAPDVAVQYVSPEALACLLPEERRQPQYTAEGWLNQIEP